MNFKVTSSYTRNNYNYQNKQHKPNFGMAVKVDESALPIIKEQVMKLPVAKRNDFWNAFREIINRQENNPVNIIVRKTERRNALAAEIIDSAPETEIVLNPKTQGVFSKNASLKFLEEAEKDANELKRANEEISKLPKATENDYYAGGINPEADNVVDAN